MYVIALVDINPIHYTIIYRQYEFQIIDMQGCNIIPALILNMYSIDGFHSIFSLGNWRALHHHAAC